MALLKDEAVSLDIAGDGILARQLKARVDSLGLSERVTFLGMIDFDDIPRIYAVADIFVLPSEGDSFGLVFVEAMASGLPVVAVSGGAVEETVHDGVNGLLAPPGDAAALSQCILEFVKDPELRRSVGQRNVEYVKERFGWDAVAQRYLDLYKTSLLKANNALPHGRDASHEATGRL